MPRVPLESAVRRIRSLAAPAADGLSDRDLLSRFLKSRDQAAFAALAPRHGPMVFGVCRRVLADRHAAEDAFQATFLVLVRKADAIADRTALGPWLYGVAPRPPLKARTEPACRRARERRARPPVPAEPGEEVARQE